MMDGHPSQLIGPQSILELSPLDMNWLGQTKTEKKGEKKKHKEGDLNQPLSL